MELAELLLFHVGANSLAYIFDADSSADSPAICALEIDPEDHFIKDMSDDLCQAEVVDYDTVGDIHGKKIHHIKIKFK